MALATLGLWVLTPILAASVAAVPWKEGDRYRVTTVSQFKGWSSAVPAKGQPSTQTEFAGQSKIIFHETILPAHDDAAVRLFRVYASLAYDRSAGGRTEKVELRPEIRRILVEQTSGGYVAYSPDAKLRPAELALFDEHAHVPALQRFLPSKDLVAGESWTADPNAVAELTGLDSIESGALECNVQGSVTIAGRELLQIGAEGVVVGSTGPARTRNKLRGGIYVEPKTGRFLSLRAVGTQETLGPEDKIVASIDVDYQVLVEPADNDPHLSAETLATLPTKPTPELLAIDFHYPPLGIEFVHSRTWILQRVDGNRLFFAGPDAAFVVTVESPGKTPTTSEFFDQVQKYAAQEKLSLKLTRPAADTPATDGNIGRFQFAGTVKNRESLLDYFVVTRGNRGATIAANANSEVPRALQDEIIAIVQSIRFFPMPTADDKR